MGHPACHAASTMSSMARDPDHPLRAQYETEFGPQLGALFAELWQELTWLSLVWNEFRALFAESPEQIQVLNQRTAGFFFMLQKLMWETILLYLARLTDPVLSPGKGARQNLTVLALRPLVKPEFQLEVDRLIASVTDKTAFARSWRNRYVAHKDLALALGKSSAESLSSGSRADVTAAIAALGEVLNYIDKSYANRTTLFEVIEPLKGAHDLVHVIEHGLKGLNQDRSELMRQQDFPRKPKGSWSRWERIALSCNRPIQPLRYSREWAACDPLSVVSSTTP